jgi:hypothetical protein
VEANKVRKERKESNTKVGIKIRKETQKGNVINPRTERRES